MESRRQSKVASVLQKAFIEILNKYGHDYYGRTFVTLTGVKITPDLEVARFYLSVMDPTQRESVLKSMKVHIPEIRKHLGNKLKNQLRHIPHPEFFLDETLDEVFRIDELLRKNREEAERLKAENPDREKDA